MKFVRRLCRLVGGVFFDVGVALMAIGFDDEWREQRRLHEHWRKQREKHDYSVN